MHHALFTLLPDDSEYGLLLANVESRSGKAQDALATVSALRRLPPPICDDPRIDLAEAQGAGALADYVHTRRAADAAAEKARQRGARLQYARARFLESGAMQSLDAAGYAGVLAEARGICAELGDRACVAAAYRIEANALAATGSPSKARLIFAQVLAIANELGNQLEKLNALIGMAYAGNTQGDLKASEADYRAAAAVGAGISTQKQYSVWANLAEVLASEGRIAESQELAEQALSYARQTGDREGIGQNQAVLARALAIQDRFADSVTAYNESVRVTREVGDPNGLGEVLFDLGDTQLKQGNLAGATKTYEEVRDLGRQHGGLMRPETEIAFARLALAPGHPEDSVVRARSAMDLFNAAGREGGRLEAAALLSRALIASGRIEEASFVLAQIPSPDGKVYPIEAMVHFRIANCLATAKAGRRMEACRSMDNIAAEVARLGLAPLETETRLAQEAVLKTTSSALPH